ncbi:MAG: SDR family oxidoreductase [Candidatus Palauibacterales bacterium]|jgi:peroxisomal 2,4-dienoyl-CoA reductase|nr:SDR family oxidoreductase [Candidatus Palauibacterales bacterium]
MTNPTVQRAFAPDLLAGQVALITGGGTGIGRGISLALARHGADIALVSRKLANMEPTAEAIRGLGRSVLALEADVRDREAIDRAVGRALEELGRIDHLINNAAGNFLAPASELSENGWRAVVDIVLNGTFNVSQAIYPVLRDGGGGSIVNITTRYVATGAPFMAHSGAAKAGVLNLTRSLAVEWGGDGIRVNAVAPGLVADTEGARRLVETIDLVEDYRLQVPLGRLATADEVADAVLFLCSPAAAYITGVELAVDGGAALGGHFKAAAEKIKAFYEESKRSRAH